MDATASYEVRSGAAVVGPVKLDQLRRGRSANKIPPDAEARAVGAWAPIDRTLTPLDGAAAVWLQGASFEVRFEGNLVGPVTFYQLGRGRSAGKIPGGAEARWVGPWAPVDGVLETVAAHAPAELVVQPAPAPASLPVAQAQAAAAPARTAAPAPVGSVPFAGAPGATTAAWPADGAPFSGAGAPVAPAVPWPADSAPFARAPAEARSGPPADPPRSWPQAHSSLWADFPPSAPSVEHRLRLRPEPSSQQQAERNPQDQADRGSRRQSQRARQPQSERSSPSSRGRASSRSAEPTAVRPALPTLPVAKEPFALRLPPAGAPGAAWIPGTSLPPKANSRDRLRNIGAAVLFLMALFALGLPIGQYVWSRSTSQKADNLYQQAEVAPDATTAIGLYCESLRARAEYSGADAKLLEQTRARIKARAHKQVQDLLAGHRAADAGKFVAEVSPLLQAAGLEPAANELAKDVKNAPAAEEP